MTASLSHELPVPKRDTDPPRTMIVGPDGSTRNDLSPTDIKRAILQSVGRLL